jgi:ribosomal protein S18 acetylase RimI-like enzyme
VLAKLARHHRSKLASLLGGTAEFSPEEVAVALELIDDALDNPSSDYRILVREDGGEVLGYACFGPTPMTQGCFDLYWLAVAQEARGRGVGGELLLAVEEELRLVGGRLIRVETAGLDAYQATRRFYERSGYAEVARIRDFYWTGNDLLIYAKYLS